ncbi:inner centromere protein [Kockovaella imperatae]|uniref:Inner centromere protein n=1 Tax=Kockovaella imperatae TaxID=4999 RepID=A0A1Y1UI18_9TREE|nr:inner centromere protein [Kockovaella imperatae]ORX37136.1 inner centromere protein [Kockovaella imperatae]
MQSEDIELPDIASEYSDSDDEDKSKDFIRPAWAESPELRHALQQQSTRDPDELFGPIKPVNMEELFKARPGKFRARSSSANWISTGDRLTRTEEIEYARRMGFRPIGTGGRTGGSTSTGGASRSSQA